MASKSPHDSGRPGGFAERRELRTTSNRERQLERQMAALDADLERARHLIESNSRTEHWGKAPERDRSWRSASPRAEP
jgi:hypothetical protein